ncbi:MAG: hypothetical protein LKE30_03110 [Bacteroidales bacterium]|nr:hypothetical protein [Bacteroidales bacterium]
MKKLLVFIIFLFFINNNFCQPTPPPTHGRNTDYPTKNNESTPIGTATGLMISFGAGFLAYKVNIAKKNDRNKNS